MEKDHWEVKVRVEAWRFTAYFFFWTMCGLAIILTETIVKKKLQDGEDPDTPIEQQGCGPCNRVRVTCHASNDILTFMLINPCSTLTNLSRTEARDLTSKHSLI